MMKTSKVELNEASVTISTDASGEDNSNVYVVDIRTVQQIEAEQVDEHTVRIKVTGDWEIRQIVEAFHHLGENYRWR